MGGWIWKSEVRQFPCQTGPRGKHLRAICLDTPRDRAFSQCDVQLVPSPLCPCLSPGVRLGRSKGSLDPGSRSFLPKEDFTLGSLLGPPTLGSWCTHAALAWGVRPPPTCRSAWGQCPGLCPTHLIITVVLSSSGSSGSPGPQGPPGQWPSSQK